MMVREGRASPRKTSQAKPEMRSHTFPAPIRGWIANENLALARPGGAFVLENWFPEARTVRARGGSLTKATISTGPVTSQWVYVSGGAEKHFAADETNIFDITSVADPAVIPAATISGQTSGYYSTAQMSTAGGDYQVVVNGTDDAQLYDGSTFTALNASTVTPGAFTGVATNLLSFVWNFKSRLFFVEKNTMRAWYLPVDQITGAASSFSLAGVFQKGGNLLFGGRWSLDAGDGLDDKCVFISSTGEVAVYEGIDPSSASAWAKVGVYQISQPLGTNATMSAGGDFLVATVDGIVPLSQAINKDSDALSLSAITRNIEPEWKKEALTRTTLPWEIIKWSEFNMAVVSLPVTSSSVEPYCFVVNLQTGAWAKYTGWDTRCMTVFDGYGYFGTSDGKVKQMEVTGSDDGTPYVIDYVGLFEDLGLPGAQKTINSARSNVLSDVNPPIKVTVETDYEVSGLTPPPAIPAAQGSIWDTSVWDEAVWDEGANPRVRLRWQGVGKTGFAIAPRLMALAAATTAPSLEIVSLQVLYEAGAVQV